MKPIILLPEAEQEMLEAAFYYQSKAPGLGIDYLSEIERTNSGDTVLISTNKNARFYA